jgi:hypothetical protein
MSLIALTIAASLQSMHAPAMRSTTPAAWGVSGPVRPMADPARYAATVRLPAASNNFLALTDAHYYQVTLPAGSALPPLTLTAAPGQTVAAKEVAANTQAHTVLVEVGTPETGALSAATPPASALGIAPDMIQPPGSGGDGSVNSAYCETGWNDFLGITVGIVWDFISFTYNGSDVVSAHSWQWQAAPFPDGDYFLEEMHGQTRSGSVVAGWTNATEVAPYWGNSAIHWDDNLVIAHGNGSVTGFAHTWASGPDAMLLKGWWQIVHN